MCSWLANFGQHKRDHRCRREKHKNSQRSPCLLCSCPSPTAPHVQPVLLFHSRWNWGFWKSVIWIRSGTVFQWLCQRDINTFCLIAMGYKVRKTHAYWETILPQNRSMKFTWVLTDKGDFEKLFLPYRYIALGRPENVAWRNSLCHKGVTDTPKYSHLSFEWSCLIVLEVVSYLIIPVVGWGGEVGGRGLYSKDVCGLAVRSS